MCSTTAATASNYTATTYAAAVIEYADCSTKVVRVVASNDGTTQLDLSSKQIVYVKSLPSVVKLYVQSGCLGIHMGGMLSSLSLSWERSLTQ